LWSPLVLEKTVDFPPIVTVAAPGRPLFVNANCTVMSPENTNTALIGLGFID